MYSSYVAGIASLNQGLVRFELRPGSEGSPQRKELEAKIAALGQ